jgi:hypothetical protein
MPTNIQNVSFASPTALIAPDLAAQQQANQQQLALAQALREQSLQEDKVDPGSHVSWTQGLARLAEALAAKHDFKQANAQTGDMARQYATALRGQFGAPSSPTPATAPDSAPASLGNALAGNPQPAPAQIPNPSYGSGGIDDDGNQSPTMPAPVTVPAAPSQSALQPDPAPVAPTMGPMSLSGNREQDMMQYEMAPEEYIKAVIASHSPTDFSKMLIQAGVDPNGPLGKQLMQAQIAKQNNIPLVSGRPGAPMYRQDGSVAAMSPQNIEGANPDIQDGRFTGAYSAAPGAAGVIASTAAAKAGGAATYHPMTAFDPTTGAPIITTDALAATAAAGGRPMEAGPRLGAAAAANVTGTNSANAFQDISNGAADVPNRIYALKNMASIVADPRSQFGPGSEASNTFKGTLAQIAQSAGIAAPSPAATTNADEFGKWATQYSARSGQELGLSGSDARTQLAVHATPNGEMTKQALQSVIPQMIGIETAKQGYATAANLWQQQHGPQTVQQFRTEWNKVYDPSIYTHMVQGHAAFAAWVNSLTPAQAAQTRQKYKVLYQIGALPQ